MSKAHILIVDDDEGIRQSLGAILTDEGFATSQAAQGEEVLDRVKGLAPDLVLLDVWLPGIDGIQMLQAIKAQHPDLEVVMMSGHGNVETAVKATKLGAFDFIEKPLSLEQVLRTVNLALRQRRVGHQSREQQDRVSRVIAESLSARRLVQEIDGAAAHQRATLLFGEDGAGKELVARVIQSRKGALGHPFVRLNCKVSSEAVLRQTLFGFEGSDGEVQTGRLEAAQEGVLFLDNVEEISRPLQEELANVLATRTFQRVGGRLTFPLDVWLVMATTTDLRQNPLSKVLGEPLGHHLGVEPIRVPPLRERREDLSKLVDLFLDQYAGEFGKPPCRVTPEAMEALVGFDWPGNVKELKDLIESLVLASSGTEIGLTDLPEDLQGGPLLPPPGSLAHARRTWEKEYIAQLLGQNRGSIARTARQLAIPARHLQKKITAYGLSTPRRKGKGNLHQRTLRRSVLLCGQGLHSGLKTGLILSPLPPNSGIQFGSITSDESVPALVDYVASTEHATTLRKGHALARTIEHLMAVLHAYRVTNLLIKLSDEVPIMDGSAKDFCQLIEDEGIEEQDAFQEPLSVKESLEVNGRPGENGTPTLRIEPASKLTIHYQLSYPPPIGVQEISFTLSGTKAFREEIAPARTFGFLREVEQLERMGLAGGGRLDNVILVDDEKVINTSLRFPDEFVRHKVLDLIGDLYLLGRPVLGRITARMSGHTENIALVRKLQQV